MMNKSSVAIKVLLGICLASFTTGESQAAGRPEAAHSNIVLTVNASTGERMQLQIDYPSAFSDRLDVYVSTNLLAGVWMVREGGLMTAGTNTLVWTDLELTNSNFRFYQVGNADVDTDHDGLPDAREILIFRTNPYLMDSDSDGVPDGAELSRGTDPMGEDFSIILLYADSDAGSDSYDGYAFEVIAGHGPKRSLGAACDVSYAHDVIQISGSTVFHEPSLCIGLRDVTLRPLGAVSVRP